MIQPPLARISLFPKINSSQQSKKLKVIKRTHIEANWSSVMHILNMAIIIMSVPTRRKRRVNLHITLDDLDDLMMTQINFIIFTALTIFVIFYCESISKNPNIDNEADKSNNNEDHLEYAINYL